MSAAAVRLGTFEPGSADWTAVRSSGLGGSEVAAVLGLSPWESRFSLWHKKKGGISYSVDTDAMRWGRFLEAPIAAWFAEQHPEYRVRRTGTWANRRRPWQLATPDRIVAGLVTRELLEVKTAHDPSGWGTHGTDEIPVYYRAQVMWQLDVLVLQRRLREWVSASAVVAELGLILPSAPPVRPEPDMPRVGQPAVHQVDQQSADLR